MRKNLIKLLSSLMLITVPLSAAGCGKDAGTNETGKTSGAETTAAATKEETTKPAEKTKLTLWHLQTTDPFPGIIQDSMDRFSKDNPNY